jgi:signal transduction histidine kinase
MQKMVRDILDFSKPADLDIGKEDIGTLVRQACDMCLTKAEKGGVDLVINISEAIGVEADPLLLKRALIDIVNNAIEASGKGQKVLISGRREGDRVIVKIEDRGKGMDEETLRNALTPFFTRKSSGTGLGLPIAKKIMDAHGGLLQVRSRLDEGTTVTITLPIRRKEH